jgi:hypothetical protein
MGKKFCRVVVILFMSLLLSGCSFFRSESANSEFIPNLNKEIKKKSTVKILFVGNSYTYAFAMPEILKELAASKGYQIEYDMQTPGGETFERHWKKGKALSKINSGKYDIIIFQDQSYEPVCDPENMFKYGKLLLKAAEKVNARRILYMTMAYKAPLKWMKKDDADAKRCLALYPNMVGSLADSYRKLAKETDSEVAPVGLAWTMAYKSIPGLNLHVADNSHPNVKGAYLTALVFFSVIYNEKPENMPTEISLNVHKRGRLYQNKIVLAPDLLKQLENIAWETVKSESKNVAHTSSL